MRNILLAAFYLSLFAACAGDGQQRQSQNTASGNQNAAPIENAKTPDKPKSDASKFVNFSIGRTDLKAGSSGAAEVKLNIQNPYHVNSNPPSEKSFIPLEVTFENGDGLTIGKPIYPKGELKRFAFSEDKPLSVYSGEIVIKLPLKVGKTVSAGQQTLNGKLKFQPCDEEVCYRPQTIDVSLPVTIN